MLNSLRNLFLLLFVASIAYSAEQTVTINKSETDTQFVERITASKISEKHLARTKKIIKESNVLVAVTESKENEASQVGADFNLQLNVLIPKKDGYQWLHTIACEIEASSPTMRAFFFANADDNPDVEIGVICGWDAIHRGADCDSNDQISFFKVPVAEARDELPQLTNEKFKAFYKQVPMKRDKKYNCTKSNFSTVADVKKLLTKIGFKQ